MGEWASAFVVAGVVALIATPVVRRVAVATGFVDRPAKRKSHAHPIPYLGGVAIMLGTLASLVWRGGLAGRVGVIAAAAVVLGITGLIDDRLSLDPRLRLFIQVMAAAAALRAGVRLDMTGIAAMDVAITLVWIVGITNAINLFDNMDGLAGGTTLVTSLGVGVLAAAGGQYFVSALAAGLAGACVGFLAHNIRPAAIFMGDAGSLFLGYLLAVAVLEVNPELVPPASFAVPFLLLALPVLDTTTVTVARLRHGRPVSSGGKDHLSHRLVAREFSPGGAVGCLLGAQAVLATLAVGAGLKTVSLEAALVVGGAVLAGLTVVTVTARVYDTPVTGLPRRVTRPAAVLTGAFLVLALPAAFAIFMSRAPLKRGSSEVVAAVDMARRGDVEASSSAFAAASAHFGEARRKVRNPMASLGKAVPVVASNLETARSLADAGTEVANAGRRLATVAQPGRLSVISGVAPVGELRRLQPEIGQAASTLERANEDVSDLGRPYLLPPVDDAVRTLQSKLGRLSREARVTADATRFLPGLLGAEGPRRYFLAVQDSAELRATGGVVGNFGELVAEDGKVRLERFGRIEELNRGGEPAGRALRAPGDFLRRYERFDPATNWQNVNMSPDFPTVASVIADLYPQSGGRPVDGVVAVDSAGLASLLKLTGPVQVAGRAAPLTSENVVDATLKEANEREQRADFLGGAARGAFDALTGASLGEPSTFASVLGEAAERRHLMVWSARPEEQRFLAAIGASTSFASVGSDSLGLVSQNAAGNKVDYYLRRRLDYRLRLVPDGDDIVVEGSLEVRLTNGAPNNDLPAIATGPSGADLEVGENRSFVTIYSPLSFAHPTLNGAPATLESEMELGRNAYSVFVKIAAQDAAVLRLDLSGRVPFEEDRSYVLNLVRQPTVEADEVGITIEVAKGWQIEPSGILTKVSDDTATADLRLDSDQALRVRLKRP